MRLAYIDGIRKEAEPRLRGKCPVCGEEVIAKCGKTKIHHWAHRNKTQCDKWWENETGWHRMWKNYFPKDWQEFVMHDEQTGEKHIADVHTERGITIEFQHSFLKEDERVSRELFYKDLVWVVDGTRLQSDFEKFRQGLMCGGIVIRNNDWAYTLKSEEYFPKNWLTSNVPVFFDFFANVNDYNLFCLMPGRADGKALIYIIPKSKFVHFLLNGKIFDIDPKEYIVEFQQLWNEANQKRVISRRPIRRSRRY